MHGAYIRNSDESLVYKRLPRAATSGSCSAPIRLVEVIMRYVSSLVGGMAVVTLLGVSALGQELRTALKDLDVGSRWQYNDWEAAQAAANRSKKPILALFR